MGEYLKPLRQKIGVITLLMACVFMAAWVRSLREGYYFTFLEYRLESEDGTVRHFSYRVRNVGDYSPNRSIHWQVSYTTIAVPLTLLSAWLLLSKPRSKKSD